MSVTLKRWPPQVPHAGDFWGKHEARIWTQRIPRESLGYPGVRCLRKGQNYFWIFPIIHDISDLPKADVSVVKLWFGSLQVFMKPLRLKCSDLPSNVIFSCFGWGMLGRCFAVCILCTETSKTIYQRDAGNPETWCCLFAMHQFVISKSIINTLFLQTTMTCAKSYEKSCEL